MRDTMTIGEFARGTGLSVSALRFYASRGLLEPVEIDPASGYRRYGPDQVASGRLIRDLRRLEMPLREITAALQLTGTARQELISEHLRRLERIVDRARTVAHTIQTTPTTKDRTMTTATLPATDLVDAFDQVLPAAGTDPEQPHLMGVLIEGKEGSIRLVATDRYRLAIRDLVPATLTEDFSAVVPAASLQRWRASLRSGAELSIGLDHKDLTIAAEGIDLAAPRLPTTFPDYQRFLEPIAEATTMLVPRADLLGVMRGFAASDDAIEVLAGADGLLLRRGGEEQRVPASIDGASQRIGINPRFLADAVEHAVGPELTVEISSPTEPVVIRSADDGTYVSMIMPYSLD